MEFARTTKKMREISVVPLIDVVLQLLIFFLMAGTVQKFELVPIDPPVAESGKIVDEGNVVILLGKHDELILNDDLIEVEQLIPLITHQLKNYPHLVVTVKADAGIPASRLIEVMDYVKAAGGRNLSLVTQAVVGK